MNSKISEKPIFLCGMMGAGKSAIGKTLAEILDVPFADLDDLIETSEKMTIPEIFDQKGEQEFRKIERRLLKKHAPGAKGVLALGGGSLQNREIVDVLKDSGWLIFINPPRSVLLERLKNSEKRPMLNDHKNELQERINRLFKERLPLYEKAHFTIVTGNRPKTEAAEQIIKKLESYES